MYSLVGLALNQACGFRRGGEEEEEEVVDAVSSPFAYSVLVFFFFFDSFWLLFLFLIHLFFARVEVDPSCFSFSF